MQTMASKESGERDKPSRAVDAETTDYIATVNKDLLDLYQHIHPRNGWMKTSDVFDKEIFRCVDYFWEEVLEARSYWRQWREGQGYIWRQKEMADVAALRFIQVYVRDWLAMSAVHKEKYFGEDVLQRFDVVHTYVTSGLHEEE